MPIKPTPPHERVLRRIEKTADGCWVFLGAKIGGYAVIKVGTLHATARMQMAHRVMYEALVGPIPEGLSLDHLCRNRACVNPDHLEPVTPAENQRRADRALGIRTALTYCKRGHEFTPENTYMGRGGTCRSCRACARYRRQVLASAR